MFFSPQSKLILHFILTYSKIPWIQMFLPKFWKLCRDFILGKLMNFSIVCCSTLMPFSWTQPWKAILMFFKAYVLPHWTLVVVLMETNKMPVSRINNASNYRKCDVLLSKVGSLNIRNNCSRIVTPWWNTLLGCFLYSIFEWKSRDGWVAVKRSTEWPWQSSLPSSDFMLHVGGTGASEA